MVIPKYRLQIAIYRFSFRTRRYWNSVPKELKVLKLEKIKIELKKHILAKKQKFLNLGLDYNVIGEIVEKKKRKKNGQKRRENNSDYKKATKKGRGENINMKNTRKIMILEFLAFLEEFLTKRITLALAFVMKFVMKFFMISKYTPSKLPVIKNLKI